MKENLRPYAIIVLLFLGYTAKAQPPQEKGYFKSSDLVELIKLD